MSGFAEKVQKAYQARQSRSIEVKEWGMTLNVYPLTIGQMAKIQAEEDPLRRAVRIIQVRAKSPDGSALFDEADFQEMVNYGIDDFGPRILGRVASEIMSDSVSSEEAEKN